MFDRCRITKRGVEVIDKVEQTSHHFAALRYTSGPSCSKPDKANPGLTSTLILVPLQDNKGFFFLKRAKVLSFSFDFRLFFAIS